MFVSCCCSAFAVSAFSDITDSRVENAVEVLRLMGVVEGDGTGKFLPDNKLSRAEFTKMAVLSLSSDADLSKFSNITIFPDVKPSAWYFEYINAAAKMGYINGLPSGLFAPDREISVAEAITILLRLIGYTDDIVGGVWPYAQETVAKGLGMMTGITYTSVNGSITRGNAAKLFVNTIMAAAKENKGGFAVSEKCTLRSIDAAGKKMTVSLQTKPIDTIRSMDTTNLIGKTGYVVYYQGKAASFVPAGAVSTIGDAAVVIGTAGDTSALTTLAGRKDYTIWKNGSRISADKLCKNDVAVYDTSGNKMLVCDTKLSVYYQACEGSPEAPSSITVLGSGTEGIKLEVLSSAYPTIAKHKPGQNISVFLTVDGKVAAAGSASYSGSNNNAVFIVDEYGSAALICGNSLIDLGINVGSDTNLFGRTVRVSSASASGVKFAAVSEGSNGTINMTSSKVGNTKIADGAMFFLNGESCELGAIDGAKSSYVRKNANDEADIIAVYDANSANITAGKGYIETMQSGGIFESTDYNLTITNKDYPQGKCEKTNFYKEGFDAYVVASYNGKIFRNVKELELKGSVDRNAISNSKLVNTKNGTLSIYNNISCYNSDTKQWTGLEDALVYGRNFKLYGIDSTVYVIEYNY